MNACSGRLYPTLYASYFAFEKPSEYTLGGAYGGRRSHVKGKKLSRQVDTGIYPKTDPKKVCNILWHLQGGSFVAPGVSLTRADRCINPDEFILSHINSYYLE